jgi:hypothetical protein
MTPGIQPAENPRRPLAPGPDDPIRTTRRLGRRALDDFSATQPFGFEEDWIEK